MRSALVVVFMLIMQMSLLAQVAKRLLLIGDAGEINAGQEAIIGHAAQSVLAGKTMVLYLGDNIYPDGMPTSDSASILEAQHILATQYEPMLRQGATVIFTAGNHDWNYSQKDGLVRVQAQSRYLQGLGKEGLQFLPANGCPDPVAVELTDGSVVILYDSSWFLYRYAKVNGEAECACQTEEQVYEQLDELLYRYRNQRVILAAHHPMHSYSVHGGYYTLTDHLFPLTNLNSKLYIPLPGIGSLYPLFRNTVLLNAEDKPHPKYSALVDRIESLVAEHPQVIYVSGHDHGLQYIRKKNMRQVVSGGASKRNHIYKGRNLMFGYAKGGYSRIDIMEDGSAELSFYTLKDGELQSDYREHIPAPAVVGSGATAVALPHVGRQDSVTSSLRPHYDQVGKLHRFFLGENYRHDYGRATVFPLLHTDTLRGGLRPTKRGGGMQSLSLRLEDSLAREYVYRTVVKRTDALIPTYLHNSFVEFILDDANSGQNPYGALAVPALASAVGVAHTQPQIGVVAADTALEGYNGTFAGQVVLFEEREPLGESDNTLKMLRKVQEDNDDTFDGKAWLRARMLDFYIADWDRHEDQWRWHDINKDSKEGRLYIPVPRDRDQALRYAEGLLSTLIYQPIFQPTMQTFTPKMGKFNFGFFKSTFLNAHPSFQLSYKDWMQEAKAFQEALTDSVIEASIAALPPTMQAAHGSTFKKTMAARRAFLPEVMDKHYRFINSIVDIRLSDKHEHVVIADDTLGGVAITVRKINKDGEVKRKLMQKRYAADMTKEVRIYLSSGQDSVFVEAPSAQVRLRIIGGEGRKHYAVAPTQQSIKLYDRGVDRSLVGSGYRLYEGADSAHTAFMPVNLYNYWSPVFDFRYNSDDGIMLGLGLKYTHNRGFRKHPSTYEQSLWALGSFATGAVRLNYKGLWRQAVGAADFNLEARAYIPQNSQNFFGLGNNSAHQRELPRSYYRARFNLYDLEPSLEWNSTAQQTTLKIGPALQYYHMNAANNEGRFILTESSAIQSYDSLSITKDKLFVGFKGSFRKDTRDKALFASRGGYLETSISAYQGLNKEAKGFVQMTAELGFIYSFADQAIVLANRVGGGVTMGKAAFYQSLFLGGQGNLRGYRGYRFAGEQMLYHNLEARLRIADISSYILPGQLGAVGLYDIGKVWAKGQSSKTWHQGYGGGLYFAPAKMFVVQYVWAKSAEGWQPYLSTGFRF